MIDKPEPTKVCGRENSHITWKTFNKGWICFGSTELKDVEFCVTGEVCKVWNNGDCDGWFIEVNGRLETVDWRDNVWKGIRW